MRHDERCVSLVCAGGRCVISHGVVVEVTLLSGWLRYHMPHTPIHPSRDCVGCVGSASHLQLKSQGRTGGGPWLLDDRPDGVREPRYHDEVILVGVPAAQPFPDLGWAAGGLHFGAGFKVSRISQWAGGRTDHQLGLTCGRRCCAMR